MRSTPRPRRPVRPAVLAILRPVLRYSYTREAFVLRGIGNHRGPVLVRAGTESRPQEQPAPPD